MCATFRKKAISGRRRLGWALSEQGGAVDLVRWTLTVIFFRLVRFVRERERSMNLDRGEVLLVFV